MNSRHKKIYKPLIFLIFICMNMFVFFDQMIQNLTKKNENLKKNFFTELSSPNLEFKWRFQRVRYNISCKSIFDMDANEIQKAKLILTSKRNHKFPEKIPDVNFIFDKSKCYQFKKALGYNQSTGSKHDFPIGFSILVHANAEQVERFIRSIYQSQNVYCIHIDTKSKQEFRDAIHSITECFDNIFITTKAENILYGGFSRLQADINCLKDLLMLDSLIKSNKNFTNKRFVDWKYAFNLVGTEFFLRTNDELVKILKMYNGSNEITILKTNRVLHRRIKNEWLEDFKTFRLVNSGRNKSAPPHGYNITYGFSTYVISKNFAKYAVFDKRAQALLEWVRTTWSPDEIYWSTLQYNTKIYSQHGFIGKICCYLIKTNVYQASGLPDLIFWLKFYSTIKTNMRCPRDKFSAFVSKILT